MKSNILFFFLHLVYSLIQRFSLSVSVQFKSIIFCVSCKIMIHSSIQCFSVVVSVQFKSVFFFFFFFYQQAPANRILLHLHCFLRENNSYLLALSLVMIKGILDQTILIKPVCYIFLFTSKHQHTACFTSALLPGRPWITHKRGNIKSDDTFCLVCFP